MKIPARRAEYSPRVALSLHFTLNHTKTNGITLSSSAAIGNSQLKSGEHKLELEGDCVLLKNEKVVDEFPVHLENEGRTFENASVTLSSEGGTSGIQEIRLGGTALKLVFSNLESPERPASGHQSDWPEQMLDHAGLLNVI